MSFEVKVKRPRPWQVVYLWSMAACVVVVGLIGQNVRQDEHHSPVTWVVAGAALGAVIATLWLWRRRRLDD